MLGGLIMYAAAASAACRATGCAITGYTYWTVPGMHWRIGGVFMIAFLSALAGVLGFIYMRISEPAFFRRETLTRAHADAGP